MIPAGIVLYNDMTTNHFTLPCAEERAWKIRKTIFPKDIVGSGPRRIRGERS